MSIQLIITLVTDFVGLVAIAAFLWLTCLLVIKFFDFRSKRSNTGNLTQQANKCLSKPTDTVYSLVVVTQPQHTELEIRSMFHEQASKIIGLKRRYESDPRCRG